MKLIFTSLLVSTFVGLQVSAVETPEAVDLGLSVKFASNVLSVSQQGSFSSFYFGETEPPAAMNSPYSLEGVDLGSDISGTLYDAAHVILGREWRMPTEGEIQELIDKCVFEVATVDGRQGWTVTGTTGNSIFICSTGTSQGKPTGSYWTSTVNIDQMLFPKRAAMIMSLKGEELQLKRHEIGAFSLAILPVLNERQGKLVESLMVNADSINLKEGSTGHVYPRITPFDAADKDVKFTSSKADVATVSGTGLITAIAPGTAEITVETVDGSGISAVCRVTVEAKPVVERKVDLGLSVQWAAFNVGASTPSEAGDYYGYAEAVTRQNYNRYDYSHYEGWSFKFPADPIGGTEYDAATVAWGGNWRTPTKDMIQELIDNCMVENVTEDGVSAFKFTSKINGNSIIIPKAGFMDGTMNYKDGAYIWTTDIKNPESFSPRAYCLSVMGSSVRVMEKDPYMGLNIRPVYFEVPEFEGLGIECDADLSDLYAGQSVTLKAVAKPAGAVLPTDDLWWECTKDDIIEFGGGDTKSTSVFALAEGTETITLHHGAFSASVTLDIKELCPTAGDEVDMGAGYLWSGCNLGAAEPQQEGNIYWWGLTEPQQPEALHEHVFPNGIDITGNPQYDPVTAELGGAWTCGTREQWNELLSGSRKKLIRYKGTSGYLLTSKTNDNSIFLPITVDKPVYAGNRWEVKGQKIYMTGTPSDDAGYARGFVAKDLASNVATVNKITTSNFAVRPVRPVSGSVGIGSIESEGSVVDVFDILGVSVLRGVTGDKLGQLEPGIYVVRTADGKSFKVKL